MAKIWSWMFQIRTVSRITKRLESSCSAIKMFCRKGQVNEALHRLSLNGSSNLDFYTYSALLQKCIDVASSSKGKLVHAHMIQCGVRDIFLETKLIVTYCRSKNLDSARHVFDQMTSRNVVSWNAMIAANIRQGFCIEALELWVLMQREEIIQPDDFTFSSVLNACAKLGSLKAGQVIHGTVVKNGYLWDCFVANSLVDMYAKCCKIDDAFLVFDEMPSRDAVSWCSLIAGCGHNENYDLCLRLFRQMRYDESEIEHSAFVFASVISACTWLGDVFQGMEVFGEVLKRGFQADVIVSNSVLDLFTKCGMMQEAIKLFETMPEKNVITWTSLLVGFVQCGLLEEAVDLFARMPEKNVVSWSSMISCYAQSGFVLEALKLFLDMPERNIISWVSLISGFVKNGNLNEALQFFKEMQMTAMNPNADAYACVLAACAGLGVLSTGREIHGEIIKNGFCDNDSVGNSLANMYVKCKCLGDAGRVFNQMPMKDVVSWNTMIAGYFDSNFAQEALELFLQMPYKNLVSWNTMISGFSQVGSVGVARRFFQEMPEKTTVSWNNMIAGYTQNCCFMEALHLFHDMYLQNIKPSSETFSIVLSACANLANLSAGKKIHQMAIKCGYYSDPDIFVANSLVDMYCKCGFIEEARIVFDRISEKDLVSWNAMILANAMHGDSREALGLFCQMQQSQVIPDEITFLAILSACCHAGLVHEARCFFETMTRNYNIIPSVEHYRCMVDILGRAGLLSEAEEMIKVEALTDDSALWASLLVSCERQNNLKIAKRVSEYFMDPKHKSDGHFVLLSNIYSSIGNCKTVSEVRKMIPAETLESFPACSWLEIKNKVYSFCAGD